MGVKVTNNAFGTISTGINNSVTTVVLDSGQGARFPTLGSGDYFFGTLIDTSNNLEIVKVTARSSDSMTVVRAQDNTTARAFAIGDRFELRPTAALFEAIKDEASVDGIDSSANATAITIDSSERVGIGTTTPDGGLHVKGVSDHGRLILESGGTSGSNNNMFLNFHNNGGTEIAQITVEEAATNSGQMVFKTGGTTTNMTINKDGHVLKPNTPGFSCAIGTGHNSGSGSGNLTATAANWGNIFQNFGSHLSGTTFTVPVTGRYFVTFGGIAGASSTSQAARMQMEVNGSAVAIQARGEEGHPYSQMAASYIIQLTANDACTIRIHDRGMWQGGSNSTGTNDPHWSMYLLG